MGGASKENFKDVYEFTLEGSKGHEIIFVRNFAPSVNTKANFEII